MERKIGEIFEYNGKWYQAVKSQMKCVSCDFMVDGHCIIDFSWNGSCFYCHRKDKEDVIFKKLEKVGEPYPKFIFGRGNIKVQRYKLYCPTNTNICNGIWIYHWKENLVDIEIKQNKEDMEEGNNPNLSNTEKIGKNLKPFDLEAAKAGKPVCTRDGRKARIICFDKITRKNYEEFKIIALVRDKDNEDIHVYNNKGRKYLDDSSVDLMMLPEKKEGWVNVYKGNNGISKYDCDDIVFNTKEEATQYAQGDNKYITTVKIPWEE